MQANHPKSDQVVQAVFSVCVSSEVAHAAALAVSRVTGSTFSGEFQEYITAARRPQFSTDLKSATGCVALIDCDRNPELALETMECLQQAFLHKVSLVAVASHLDAGFLLRAMRAGCNEFLNIPVDVAELEAALTRFQNGHIAAALTTQGLGKIISFYGVKGGVGTTTLAVHLATHLVRTHRKKILLIDHKQELGHIGLYLGIKEGRYHFDELIRNVDRLDADLLEGFVTRHISGLEVIPSPDACSIPHESSADAIERVMEYLRHHYDYVLVDSSMQYTDSRVPMMTASDEVMLICTPDVAALRDLARHIEHLNLTNTSKLRVIINRSASEDAVTSEQIERMIGFPVSMTIPNNYRQLMEAINAGEPVSPQNRNSFSQAFGKWASRLITDISSTIPLTTTKTRFNFWR
jgi:pilus assembly protein CpaE